VRSNTVGRDTLYANASSVYHVFEQGELELLVEEAASQMPKVNVELEVSGWEKGNWYGIWKRIDVNKS